MVAEFGLSNVVLPFILIGGGGGGGVRVGVGGTAELDQCRVTLCNKFTRSLEPML